MTSPPLHRYLAEHPAVAALAVATVALGAVYAAATTHSAPQTAYQRCVHAGDTRGPSGYAPEVCEPLAPGYTLPPWVRIAEVCTPTPEPATCIQAEIDKENGR